MPALPEPVFVDLSSCGQCREAQSVIPYHNTNINDQQNTCHLIRNIPAGLSLVGYAALLPTVFRYYMSTCFATRGRID
ncbi:hypothetical protein L211DRAFT_835181 [Terfezia boudieri ATCC MYA-4762]|uniref:Uncharacterized protein n=1 Tax=Terfezia boudieri ATCC MYA-4762 TaxID=1051890 RepID=A0A3N4LVB2_9PEZI|nr:hypothetical protein L211DRAFT_835181 [Terfezia boudieri ATCC MYA-4762]